VPRREDWGFTDTYSENARRQREAELENRIDILVAELHIKNEECSELAKKYSNAILKVSLQSDKIAQLENALAVAEEAHDAISERCEELHGQINGLRAELQKQKETAGESIEALQEAVAEKQSVLAALESDKSSMADIIRELNKEIEEQKNARIDLEDAYSDLESKHSECSITLEEARAKIAEMKDELDIAQADMNNVNAQLTEALEEIDTLENQLLEIKKPFSSGIGKVIAKIINWLINTFGGNDGTNT
jgi:chromosome segregation ATPase